MIKERKQPLRLRLNEKLWVEYENGSGSIYRDDESIHEGWVE